MKNSSNYKYKPREEVFYYWAAKNDYFKAVVLKHIDLNKADPANNYYKIRILNYQKDSWNITVQESSLSPLENPNKLMKDLI